MRPILITIIFLLSFIGSSQNHQLWEVKKKMIHDEKFIYDFSDKTEIVNFGKYIWKKQDGKIVFNSDNMNIIREETSKNNLKYLWSLRKYIDYISQNNLSADLTFEEQSMVIAYLLYQEYHLSVLANQTDICSIIGFLYEDNEQKYFNEFEEHTYYNLDGFAELYHSFRAKYKSTERQSIQYKTYLDYK